MKRIPIGAVIEIPTAKGYAYALYTHEHEKPPRYGSLLRVFGRLYAEQQTEFEWMAKDLPQFDTFFPLGAAANRRIVRVAGAIDIPEWARAFPTFRSGTVDPRTMKVAVWWLWDGEKEWRIGSLSPEQRRLSLGGIINDTMLKELIEEGWTPENDTR